MAVKTKYARLGMSGIEVSKICLGTNNFGGQLSADAATKVIRRALDLGVNFIDTANVYTDGRSEEIVGKAVKGDRERLVIATKVGYPMGGEPDSPNLSRKNILAKAWQSLQRLQTDHIDLYYLHAFDPKTPLTESLEAMNGLMEEGKVRHYGVSNYTLEQLRNAVEACEDGGWAKPVALQPRYNLLMREAENDLLPYCAKVNLGVATYSPLIGGLLTGKYNQSGAPPPGSRAAFRPAYWERIRNLGQFQAVEKLRSISEETDCKPNQLAIAWVLRNPAVTSAIVGASSPGQVDENCIALEKTIPDGVFEKLGSLPAQR
jgi:1-deoxyxylulose-5-phosphate synthase